MIVCISNSQKKSYLCISYPQNFIAYRNIQDLIQPDNPFVEPGFHVAYIIRTRHTAFMQKKHRWTQVANPLNPKRAQ